MNGHVAHRAGLVFLRLIVERRRGWRARITVKEWHSRHIRFTWLRLSSRGFEEPCGVWQATQPSIFTASCSYTNGPALSAWHLKQTVSCAAVARNCRVKKPAVRIVAIAALHQPLVHPMMKCAG